MANGGYVYLLADVSCEGIYKIGVTRGSIEKRIKKLQTGNSGDIFLVDYYYSEHPFFVERWLHIKFFSKKVLNEWFEMTLEDRGKFKDMCREVEELYKYSKIGNYED